ncbi:hypothetical protein PCANC_10132 [Puccinia coronata f. sp. avenae]|uniref:Uncharacterized protein n=1 Tax=Puccinia coronata f. sp. avenae TaxID=200324 RepID=A0A2N5V692_9BASI|nr:hypothetical protein PCANC_10132 [Puccinia coronata f. sp. avenae]
MRSAVPPPLVLFFGLLIVVFDITQVWSQSGSWAGPECLSRSRSLLNALHLSSRRFALSLDARE